MQHSHEHWAPGSKEVANTPWHSTHGKSTSLFTVEQKMLESDWPLLALQLSVPDTVLLRALGARDCRSGQHSSASYLLWSFAHNSLTSTFPHSDDDDMLDMMKQGR